MLPFQSPNCQVLFPVNPVQALMIHLVPAPFQQRSQAPIAEARLLPRQFDQVLAQLRVILRPWFISITAAIHRQQLASPALTEAVFGNHESHILPLTYKLQPFFRMTPFRASRSRLRSATSCFRRRFSSSSSFKRRASFTSIPPYLLFQVHSVAALTPSSRANSGTFRPASICFSTPMICSSLCRVFFTFEDSSPSIRRRILNYRW